VAAASLLVRPSSGIHLHLVCPSNFVGLDHLCQAHCAVLDLLPVSANEKCACCPAGCGCRCDFLIVSNHSVPNLVDYVFDHVESGRIRFAFFECFDPCPCPNCGTQLRMSDAASCHSFLHLLAGMTCIHRDPGVCFGVEEGMGTVILWWKLWILTMLTWKSLSVIVCG
jgi:hypothetical protein